MATGTITKSSVDALRPGPKDQVLWDGKVPGFGVKVTPAGSKVFLFQYRLGGRGSKVRRYTIGKFGALTAESARRQAQDLAAKVLRGVDPQSERATKRREAIDLAFPSYLDAFVSDCIKADWKGSADEVEAMLRKRALPSLKSKALPEITRSDISAIIRPVRDKPGLANKLFAVLRYMFRHAVSEGDLLVSPMEGMKPPPVPAARDRILSDDELALIWSASGGLGSPFGPMVRELILTGARRNEVAALPWAELSQDKAEWSLPASRAKNGEATVYPLSSPAVAEMDCMAKALGKSRWPNKGFVFTTTKETAVSGFSRAKSRLDALIKKANGDVALPDWRLHDLRRTLATGMQRLGVRFEVTEAILNHRSGSRSGVAGVYQRHDWLPEKRDALRLWAAHCAAVAAGHRAGDFKAADDEDGVKGWKRFVLAWAGRGGPPDNENNVVPLASVRA